MLRRLALVSSLFLGATVSNPATAAEFPSYLGALSRGEVISAVPTLSDPTQTYDLYLPTALVPGKRLPLLLLFDPRSRGTLAAELFRPAAEELGWILVASNNTMSDGPGQPNTRAINATLPDAIQRLPVDEKRIYAGGFSGGGVLAWTVGLKGRYLAGVISIGGRPAPEHAALVPTFPLFAAAGLRDPNYQATRELDAIATTAGVPHRLEFFPGPHSWCPPETARRALIWLETLAMRDGLAPRDAGRVARFFAEEMLAAEALVLSDGALAAGNRFRTIADSFQGLGEPAGVDRAARRAGELLSSSAAKSSVKEARAAEKYETQGSRRIGDAIVVLRSEENPPAARLRQIVGLEEAKRRAAEGGEMGRAAGRHLEAIATHLGFYLTRELFAKGDYARARPALTVATEARPADPYLHYNLACAQARSGDPDGALQSLSLALDHGLAQPLQFESDPDLVSLRDLPEFRALLERTRHSNAGS